jgi:hypothetical protein
VGVDICLFIVIIITHGRFSIINNGGGVETDPPPQGIPGHLVWGVKQTTGGFNPPPPPGNSNTASLNLRGELRGQFAFGSALRCSRKWGGTYGRRQIEHSAHQRFRRKLIKIAQSNSFFRIPQIYRVSRTSKV